jgi:hypothetical protein
VAAEAAEAAKEKKAYGPGMATVDRFKLNNLSFAGPVVMGVGGRKKERNFTS